MSRTPVAACLALSAVLLLGAPAAAAARLVSSTPAGGASVGPVRRIQLHFNQPVSRTPTADLVSTRMMMGSQMMSHIMPIGGAKAAVDPNDPKTVVVTAPSALGSGDYKLAWKVTTVAGETLSGDLTFTVK